MRIRIRKTVANAYYRMLGHYPVTVGSTRLKCDPYHIKFWKLVNRNEWEPHTFSILDKYLDSDTVYCDIGTWIGPTVIYAAKKCSKVYCFEPDTVAYRFLLWNISLNGLKNVMPMNIGLSRSDEVATISSLGTGLGDSMTSLLGGKNNDSIDIYCMQWSTLFNMYNPDRIDVVKIDIEGGEFELLPTLRDYLEKHKPTLYLSLHAPFLDQKTRKGEMQTIIDCLGHYSHCLDENFRETEITHLLTDEVLNNFTSFIFSEKV